MATGVHTRPSLAVLRQRSHRSQHVAPEPVGADFFPLADFAPGTPARAAMIAQVLAGRGKGRGDFSASIVIRNMGDCLAEVFALTLLTENACLALPDSGVLVHWHEDGRIDAVHLGAATLLPPDADGLAEAADRVVRLLDPIYTGAREGFGRPAAWRSFIDSLLGHAAAFARQDRHDCRSAIATVMELAEAVIARLGMRIKIRVDWVAMDGVELAVPIRTSCCLVYHVREREQSPIAGYCTTCPLISDADRAQPVRDALARERIRVDEERAARAG